MSAEETDGTRPRAVALRYGREERRAPEVVAKGAGTVAERILQAAREHDVPVREDSDLVTLLSACDLGEEIPTELYGAVAEVIAFLYDVNGRLREERSDQRG